MSNNEPRDASHYHNGFSNPAGRISELENMLEFAKQEIESFRDKWISEKRLREQCNFNDERWRKEMIKVKLLNERAKAPTQGTPGSAGLDLYATDHAVIPEGAHVKIPTGISVAIPDGQAGFIWPRSGLATKHGFDLLAGLVDSDYRGEIHVCGINHGNRAIEIYPGDRIAQLVVSPVTTLMQVCENLEDPETRSGGFGSTGV